MARKWPHAFQSPQRTRLSAACLQAHRPDDSVRRQLHSAVDALHPDAPLRRSQFQKPPAARGGSPSIRSFGHEKPRTVTVISTLSQPQAQRQPLRRSLRENDDG